MADKNSKNEWFWYYKIYFIQTMLVQWSRSCSQGQMSRVRLPATPISVLCTVLFFFSVQFFLNTQFFSPVFFYSYRWPCRSPTKINIYIILSLSRESFILENGFQEFLICILAKLTARKLNISISMSIHVPPLKQLYFLLMLVDIMTNNTQYWHQNWH